VAHETFLALVRGTRNIPREAIFFIFLEKVSLHYEKLKMGLFLRLLSPSTFSNVFKKSLFVCPAPRTKKVMVLAMVRGTRNIPRAAIFFIFLEKVSLHYKKLKMGLFLRLPSPSTFSDVFKKSLFVCPAPANKESNGYAGSKYEI